MKGKGGAGGRRDKDNEGKVKSEKREQEPHIESVLEREGPKWA